MKIGKTIKVVTSPKRNIQKANKKKAPESIPVKMPEKVPATAEWKYAYHWGVDTSPWGDATVFITAD